MKNNFKSRINFSKLKGTNLAFLVVLTMIATVGIFFIIVFNLNESLNWYSNIQGILRENFNSSLAPKYSIISIPSYIGVSGILFIFIFDVLFLVLLKKIAKYEKTIISIFISLYALTIVFTFLISIGEFAYANFSTSFELIKSLGGQIEALKNNEFVEKIMSYSHTYKWTNDRTTWWLQFLRLALILIAFMIFRSTFYVNDKYAEDVSKNIETSIKRTNIGKNKLNKFIGKVFSTSEKSTSWWALIVTIIVLMPQIIYVVLLSIDNSEINSVIQWTVNGKSIAHALNKNDLYDALNRISSPSRFVMVDIPIIIVGATLVTCSAFVFDIIRQWRTDIATFATQLSILSIEMVLTLSFGAISKGYVNHIVNCWNNFGICEKMSNINIPGIENIFHMPIFNSENKLDHVWLYGLEFVSEFVISFSFFIVCYVILSHKLLLITKMRKDQKEKLSAPISNE